MNRTQAERLPPTASPGGAGGRGAPVLRDPLLYPGRPISSASASGAFVTAAPASVIIYQTGNHEIGGPAAAGLRRK